MCVCGGGGRVIDPLLLLQRTCVRLYQLFDSFSHWRVPCARVFVRDVSPKAVHVPSPRMCDVDCVWLERVHIT